MFKKLAVLLAVAGLALPAVAETFDIDPAHSSVGFKVAHMVVSRTHGKFDRFKGTFDYVDGKPKKWKAEAVIDAKSVDTDNKKRDRHLRSADFLDVENCPTIKFLSTRVAKKKGGYEMLGDLTIRCRTRPVVLDMEARGSVDDPWGHTRAGFTAVTTIIRQDFGVAWNKKLKAGGLLVGNEVEITIEVEGIARKPEKQADRKN